MKRFFGALALVTLSGCSTVPYQGPATAFQSALSDFTKAQASYGQTYSAPEIAARAQEPEFLESAYPIAIDTSCTTISHAALGEATRVLASNGSLDPLYAPGGRMANPATCHAGVIPAPAAPRAAAAAARVTKPAFDEASADAEAQADAVACRAYTVAEAPVVSSQVPTPADRKSDLGTIWSALGDYAAGLVDLSSASNKKSLSDAEAGTSAAIKSDLANLKDKNLYSSITDLLFAAFDAAINQARYNALRRAVTCVNAGLIRTRPVLRSAARYQQIAGFDNLASAFEADAKAVMAAYNPDPNPDQDCPRARPTNPVMRKRGALAESVKALPVWSKPCLYARAREVAADPRSSAQEAFLAHQLLLSRALALGPILARLEQEASAANAMAANDPGPLTDAFIETHRKLRDAIVSGRGQFGAVYDSLSTLGKDAKAVNDAINAPAAKTSSKS